VTVQLKPLNFEVRFLFMKKLFSSPDIAELGLFKSRLEEAGIACEVRNANVSIALPGAAFYPELWLLRDEDCAEAEKLIQSWRRPTASLENPWTCAGCGEVMEGQFASCWKCGRERGAA
jgi:hypothetical protein